MCLPRVSYRALPSFHPGLCRSAALSGLIVVLLVCTQGFISDFALISPWTMQECRPFRAFCRIGCVYPGFQIGLCPHFTLGYAGVSPFQGSSSDWLFVPRVPYRSLPSFHPGLCRSIALSGLFVGLAAFPQGFISGFASFRPGLCRSAALAGLNDVFINYLLLLMCLSDTGRNKSMG